jgi:hypothetical protein
MKNGKKCMPKMQKKMLPLVTGKTLTLRGFRPASMAPRLRYYSITCAEISGNPVESHAPPPPRGGWRKGEGQMTVRVKGLGLDWHFTPLI